MVAQARFVVPRNTMKGSADQLGQRRSVSNIIDMLFGFRVDFRISCDRAQI